MRRSALNARKVHPQKYQLDFTPYRSLDEGLVELLVFRPYTYFQTALSLREHIASSQTVDTDHGADSNSEYPDTSDDFNSEYPDTSDEDYEDSVLQDHAADQKLTVNMLDMTTGNSLAPDQTGEASDPHDTLDQKSLRQRAELGNLRWVPSSRIPYEPPTESDMIRGREHFDTLTPTQAQDLDRVLGKFQDMYSTHRWDVGKLDPKYGSLRVKVVKQTTEKGHNPRFSHIEEAWIADDLALMQKHGIIAPSQATDGAPIRYVAKPIADTETDYANARRLTINFMRKNTLTECDNYPLPTLEESLMKMGRPKYFTTIDATQGFFQLPVHPSSQEFLSFNAGKQGTWKFLRAPMGYKGSPSAYSSAMDRLMRTLPVDEKTGQPFVSVYIDDLCIFSLTFEDHLKHIEMVLTAMQTAGLKIKPSKCHFAFTSLSFLGFRIDRHGVRIDPDKAKPILQIPEPETPQAMRSFLAMSGYYRTHLKGFAELASILRPRETALGNKAPWTDEERWAFSEIKRLLTTEPCLRRPDYSLPWTITTDWSKRSIGAVLSQVDPETGEEYVVRYARRQCTGPESRLSPTQGECLALIFGMTKFRPYIYGLPGDQITARTDHHALIWLMTTDKCPKLHRWADKLSEYGDFRIVHILKGTDNKVADALSRPYEDIPISTLLVHALTSAHDEDTRTHTELMNAFSVNAVRPEYTSKPDEDYTPYQFGKYVKCSICGHQDGAPNMVECSGCGTFQHRDCLNPFHYEPISGEFLCSNCDPDGVRGFEAYFQDPDDVRLQYHERDPYLDEALLQYLGGNPNGLNANHAVAKRAARIRIHPTIPGFLQCFHKETWHTVPPVNFREEIIRTHHESTGHRDKFTTLAAVKAGGYWWRNMATDVENHVLTCPSCQITAATNRAALPIQEVSPVTDLGAH